MLTRLRAETCLLKPVIDRHKATFLVVRPRSLPAVQLKAACRKGGKGRRCDAAVAGDEEVGPAVARRLTWDARYPPGATAIPQFLWLGDPLILKVRMSSPECARDAIDLVAATVKTLLPR